MQNLLLETFRQLLWFIKSAYWRKGGGEKKGCHYSRNRDSPKPYAKINPPRPGCIQGNLAAGLELVGWPQGDGEPVSTGPTRFSKESKSPRKTAPPCRPWAPIPIPPTPSEMRTWLILLPFTLEGSPLTPGSTHPLGGRSLTQKQLLEDKGSLEGKGGWGGQAGGRRRTWEMGHGKS